MRWSQLNLERKLWTIPGTKSEGATPGRTSKVGGSYQIPLADSMVDMLRSIRDSLPAAHGDFVFSFTNGQTPLGNFNNLKQSATHGGSNNEADLAHGRFDRLMRAALELLSFEYLTWVWHDVRRTVRTHLEPITGRTEVAEAAVGHGKTGIERVYNLHKYRAEIRRAFNAWSALLQRVEDGTCTIADWEHDPEAF
jgi:integrase